MATILQFILVAILTANVAFGNTQNGTQNFHAIKQSTSRKTVKNRDKREFDAFPRGGQGYPSSTYGAPLSTYGAPSSTYRAPSTGNPSSTYGVPSTGNPSTYGAPSSTYGAPSSTYGAPSIGNPSSTYGAPSSTYGAPSTGFQGYTYPRPYQPPSGFIGGGFGGGAGGFGGGFAAPVPGGRAPARDTGELDRLRGGGGGGGGLAVPSPPRRPVFDGYSYDRPYNQLTYPQYGPPSYYAQGASTRGSGELDKLPGGGAPAGGFTGGQGPGFGGYNYNRPSPQYGPPRYVPQRPGAVTAAVYQALQRGQVPRDPRELDRLPGARRPDVGGGGDGGFGGIEIPARPYRPAFGGYSYDRPYNQLPYPQYGAPSYFPGGVGGGVTGQQRPAVAALPVRGPAMRDSDELGNLPPAGAFGAAQPGFGGYSYDRPSVQLTYPNRNNLISPQNFYRQPNNGYINGNNLYNNNNNNNGYLPKQNSYQHQGTNGFPTGQNNIGYRSNNNGYGQKSNFGYK